MKCINCGRALPEDFKYCPECGSAIQKSSTSQTQYGILVVRRNASMVEHSLQADIFVDEEKVGYVNNNMDCQLKLPIGKHAIKIMIRDHYIGTRYVDINPDNPCGIQFAANDAMQVLPGQDINKNDIPQNTSQQKKTASDRSGNSSNNETPTYGTSVRYCSCCGTVLHGDVTICPTCNTINRLNVNQSLGGEARKHVQSTEKKSSSNYNYNQPGHNGNASPQNDMDALLSETKAVKKSIKTMSGFLFVFLVLFILAGWFVYSFFLRSDTFVLSESSIVSHKVLSVVFEDDIDKNDQSDSVQVKNALRNGGLLRILDEIEGYDYSFGSSEYEPYGAVDADGNYFVKGAVLNYIASNGWTLIQAPITGLSNIYYFVK